MTPRVAHLIRQIGFGGASQAAILAARFTPRVTPTLISLLPAVEPGLGAVRAAGLEILSAPDTATLYATLADADLVLVHFWNNPDLYHVLRSPWPPARVLVWSHVAGHYPPQILPPQLAAWADGVAVTSPVSLTLPALAGSAPGTVFVAPPHAELAAMEAVPPRSHAGYVVGYLGTVDFAKLHPDFVRLCANVNVPAVRFLVAGLGGGYEQLRQQAQALGAADRFEMRGFVKSVGAYLAELDVFGYPLAPGNYATAELVVQEAQYAGAPPVVFDQPSMRHVVRHNNTGLLVSTAEEYCHAIEYLYHHPVERARLSANARDHARRQYRPERTGEQLAEAIEMLLRGAKRSRTWPTDPHADRWPSAAEFVASLAGSAPEYQTSLTVADDLAALAADGAIERADAAMGAPAAGGVMDYRRHDPGDGMLRLWAGLVLLGQGRPALALAEFRQAQRLGLTQWRVDWHIARAAQACAAPELAAEALARVRAAAPQFSPAHAPDAGPRSAE